MSEFYGYEKMPKSLKKWGLCETDFPLMEKLEWVVTEKVHGANFSFVYEDRKLMVAKRKAYLSWEDDFFGFQLVVNQMEERIIGLFEQLHMEEEGGRFIIYGELFGGTYPPHPDVSPDDRVQAVQTGIYYSPHIGFCAFDIAVVTDEDEKHYLDYDRATELFGAYGIFHAKPLFVGSLTEALDFDIRIHSTIPIDLGWPALSDNIIEGVVIKPFRHTGAALSKRPILKLKNSKFDEEEKFHGATKWSYVPTVTSHAEELHFLVEELSRYVTSNRLDSAISKIGALDSGNSQRVQEIKTEFLQDTLADFDEDNGGIISELSEVQKAWITARVEADIERLMLG